MEFENNKKFIMDKNKFEKIDEIEWSKAWSCIWY